MDHSPREATRNEVAAEESSDAASAASIVALTAALGDPTRREIYFFTREHPGVTVGEVAEHYRLHPNVARHHLEKLTASGYLEVRLGAEGPRQGLGRPGAGRPAKHYQASPDAGLLPNSPHRDELLGALLSRALSLLDPCIAEEMAAAVGEEYGRSLAARIAPGGSARSITSALETVVRALTAQGFAAHARTETDGLAVVRDHCPFGALALENPVICAVDRGMVQGLMAALCADPVPVRLSSRARGAAACSSIALGPNEAQGAREPRGERALAARSSRAGTVRASRPATVPA